MPPFKPGESGNPNGRPPGVQSARIPRATQREIVRTLVERALCGDVAAADVVLRHASTRAAVVDLTRRVRPLEAATGGG